MWPMERGVPENPRTDALDQRSRLGWRGLVKPSRPRPARCGRIFSAGPHAPVIVIGVGSVSRSRRCGGAKQSDRRIRAWHEPPALRPLAASRGTMWAALPRDAGRRDAMPRFRTSSRRCRSSRQRDRAYGNSVTRRSHLDQRHSRSRATGRSPAGSLHLRSDLRGLPRVVLGQRSRPPLPAAPSDRKHIVPRT